MKIEDLNTGPFVAYVKSLGMRTPRPVIHAGHLSDEAETPGLWLWFGDESHLLTVPGGELHDDSAAQGRITDPDGDVAVYLASVHEAPEIESEASQARRDINVARAEVRDGGDARDTFKELLRLHAANLPD